MKRIGLAQDEAFALVGFVALTIGLALVSVPAALIVAGALLIVYAVLPDRTGGPIP